MADFWFHFAGWLRIKFTLFGLLTLKATKQCKPTYKDVGSILRPYGVKCVEPILAIHAKSFLMHEWHEKLVDER